MEFKETLINKINNTLAKLYVVHNYKCEYFNELRTKEKITKELIDYLGTLNSRVTDNLEANKFILDLQNALNLTDDVEYELKLILNKLYREDYLKELIIELITVVREMLVSIKETKSLSEAGQVINDLNNAIVIIIKYAVVDDLEDIPEKLEQLAMDCEHIDEPLSKSILYNNIKNNVYNF